jgi:hypothetical protein
MKSNKAPKLSRGDSPHGNLPIKKRVRFSETSTLIVVPGANYNNWYSKDEVRAFKRDIRASVAEAKSYSKVMKCIGYSVQQGNAQLNLRVDDSIRGLEHLLSPELLKVLNFARTKSIKDILQGQSRQRSLGLQDEESIAKISKLDSKFVVELRRVIAEL